MIVIGVTGTKGKSTTSYLIAEALARLGEKAGLSSTAVFKIGEREWVNPTKMTMLGRFGLQRLLRNMVAAGCRYAVVETSSEGIAQHRHRGIEYDVAVFTNLAPEHIEAHGSFEKYKDAKLTLFRRLAANRRKDFFPKKVAVVNVDDAAAEDFLAACAGCERWGFTQRGDKRQETRDKLVSMLTATNTALGAHGADFTVEGTAFRTSLIGAMNVENALAAITTLAALGFPLSKIAEALPGISGVPGRMEFVATEPFIAIVDYAHNPSSFRALYEAVKLIPHERIIHVFGATGGGRDKTKRAEMGEIAARAADIVIETTDDSYDEDPAEISKAVVSGANKADGAGVREILDRKEAIEAAIALARPRDLVLITGKGCEQVQIVGGERRPWDDRTVAREAIRDLQKSPQT